MRLKILRELHNRKIYFHVYNIIFPDHRCPMEVNVELGEATVLRGTIAIIETAYGETSGLQVSTSTEAHLYCRWQEDAYLRVQVPDAATTTGDAAVVVS